MLTGHIMNKFLAKLCTFFISNRELRHKKRERLIIGKNYCNKLIMTLLVKDEADIIEDNILFHKAMGVDGIIVTNNNSSDNTREILEKYKKEGIILEIIDEPNSTYMQEEFVDRMILIAKNKYKADWVINADADEFWYSNCENLKKSITKEQKRNSRINVIYAYQKNFSPIEDKEDFISSPYFIQRCLSKAERELFNIPDNHYYVRENTTLFPKVIHTTRNYKQIAPGNHDVSMKKRETTNTSNITIYHYHVRNYKHFERKTITGGKSLLHHPNKNIGTHWRKWYQEYINGNLKNLYNSLFDLDQKELLLEQGVIAKDTTVKNVLKLYKRHH